MADLTPDERKLYNFLVERGSPANQDHIQAQCMLEDSELLEAINGLIQKSRIELYNQGNTALFSAITEENLEIHKVIADLSHDEGAAYQVIDKANDSGVWMATIRKETSIPAPRLRKVLKALETKKLIKSFKSFGSKAKLHYIKYDLTPNKKLCGGVFWDITTNAYDMPFINTIKKFFAGKVKSKIHITVAELREDYVHELRETGIAQVDLEVEDVQQIINILIYDGEIEPVITSGSSEPFYRPSFLNLPKLGVTEIPCIRCPVANQCSDDGDITPERCVYLQKWLDF